LPDEKLDGKPAYVLEARLRPDDPQAATSEISRTLYYYDKETGLIVRVLAYDRKGKVASTTITSEIRTDADIAADRFIFEPPEGIKIEELPGPGENAKP